MKDTWGVINEIMGKKKITSGASFFNIYLTRPNSAYSALPLPRPYPGGLARGKSDSSI
jgi:hypothetical protein